MGISNRSTIVKLIALALAGTSILLAPSAGFAQAAASAPAGPVFSVGAVVYDPQGMEAGKISGVADNLVTIDTGAHKAALPKNAFSTSAKGLTVTVTKAQIDEQVSAAMAQAAAALDAALVPGAEVRGKAGTVVGNIKEVNGDQVVVDRPAGPVSLAKNVFTTSPQGLMISVTAEQLDAAAKASAPAT